MEQRTTLLGLTTLAAVVVAASSVRAPGARLAPAAPADSAAPAAARSSPSKPAVAAPRPFTQGRALLRRFFGGDAALAGGSRYHFDVLIATLPDPADSHLDWAFDTGLEAVRRAFESSGYVVDGLWLPPRDSVALPGGRGTVPRREVEPGVMLFRGTDARRPRLHLVYLVLEVPTSGIYKDALRTALRERRDLLGKTGFPLLSDRTHPLRIVGPMFSGSALSLQVTLRGEIRKGDRVKVVSGSATSLNNLETLTCDSLGIRFSATVNPDESLREALDRVLDSLRIPDDQVAVLQESSTQYGQSVLAGGDTLEAAAPSVCGGRLSRDSTDAGHGFLVVPFPMSISSLRSEYQRLSTSPAPGPSVPGTAPAPRLPLDLIDPVRLRQDLPVTSALTPPAVDLVLDEVARTLRNHHIRLIGLLATDVRDKLFLGRELRQRVRDAQFFTFESNVLYLRSDHSRWLRGMMVFSTYPLLLESHLGGPDSSHLAFANEGAQGIYNATLVQLENRRALRDYGEVDSGGVPPGRPSVWVTTIGNQVFLPLKADSSASSTCYVEPGSGDTRRPPCGPVRRARRAAVGPVPGALDFIDFLPFAATTLVGVALVVLAVATWRDPRRPWRPMAPTDLTGTAWDWWETVQQDSLRIHQHLYTALRLSAAAAVFVVAVVPFGLLLQQPSDLRRGLVVALIFSGGLGLLGLASSWWSLLSEAVKAAGGGLRFLFSPTWGTVRQHLFWGAEMFGRLLVAVWGLAYLGFSLWFGWSVLRLGQDGSENARMFLLRAGAVDSLVSPVLPLILAGAGFAVWASWHLRRVALLQVGTVFEGACARDLAEQCVCRSPVSMAFTDDLRRAARAVAEVRMRLFLLLPGAGSLVLLGVLVVLTVWIWPQFGSSFESLTLSRWGGLSPFDWLFRTSILASFAAITWAAYRLLAVWRALRHCLAAIRGMPLLSAFERLPPEAARAHLLRTPGTDTTEPELIPDQQWLQLGKIYKARRPEILAAIPRGKLTARMDLLMRYPSARPLLVDTPARDLEIERFRRLHEILRDLWELEPGAGGIKVAGPGLQEAPAPASGKVGSDTAGRLRRTFAGAAGLWRRAAEEYAAGVVTDYLHWSMRQLYVLALFLLLALLLMTALLSSYPFQPQSLLKLVFFFLLLFTVGAMMLVLLQANRDEVLSRINQTEPGRITWSVGFAGGVLTFGLLPLLTLLSSEFPALRDAVFSWVEPLVKLVVKP